MGSIRPSGTILWWDIWDMVGYGGIWWDTQIFNEYFGGYQNIQTKPDGASWRAWKRRTETCSGLPNSNILHPPVQTYPT